MQHPDGTPFQPVEYPLPILLVTSMQSRVVADDARENFTLRFTPAMPVGPNIFAPAAQQHHDYQLTAATVNQIIESFAQVMTQEQKVLARAALSDIDVPTKPKLEIARDIPKQGK